MPLIMKNVFFFVFRCMIRCTEVGCSKMITATTITLQLHLMLTHIKQEDRRQYTVYALIVPIFQNSLH